MDTRMTAEELAAFVEELLALGCTESIAIVDMVSDEETEDEHGQ